MVIDWLQDQNTPQSEKLRILLESAGGVLAPITVTELLSAPGPRAALQKLLPAFYVLETEAGYWERTGELRAKLIKAGRKAALGDALIAQACIDADVPLLTRDKDFAAFAKVGGLKLA